MGLSVQEVWLKLEHLQVSGSFKARGMFNRMRSHPIPAAGVIIASGGNAGIAVACAADSGLPKMSPAIATVVSLHKMGARGNALAFSLWRAACHLSKATRST